MIIIAGWIDVRPDERDDYLAARREGVLASRAEPGCIDYVFSADPMEPGRVWLFERWESEAALEQHRVELRSRQQPTHEVLGRAIHVYSAEAAEPLA